jgi:beta-glucuronidase
MDRLFSTHEVRPRHELDGLWTLTLNGAADGAGDPPSGTLAGGRTVRVLVPSCVESIPGAETFRGVARYERTFDAGSLGGSHDEDRYLRVACQGVSHMADVSVDGTPVAHHEDAFTAFDGLIEHRPGMRTITIDADNRFSERSALHRENDYYSYGGVTRPVLAELVPERYVDWIHVTPFRQDGAWRARVEVRVASCRERLGTGEPGTVDGIVLRLDGRDVRRLTAADATEDPFVYRCVLDVPDAVPWTPDAPHLTYVQAVLVQDGREVDDLIDRFGFREVRVEGDTVLLNDEPIRFVGFNRHEDDPVFGCALPVEAMMRDLNILRDLGATSVRTSHYPNDERFLDLCDELGLLVWEEAHARGPEDEHNPRFLGQSLASLTEMVTQHFNHPSIYTWGILNEYESNTEYGRSIYVPMYERLRELDPSRPTTSATCNFPTDICLDLPDIVSVNVYPLWYRAAGVAEYMGEVLDFVRSSPGGGKPLIVSEIGAGAIPGFRDTRRAKWSEERQADILSEQLGHVCELDEVTGVYIWQFADCRVTEGLFAHRPRTRNNKGVVDEYRRPKLAYETVREVFDSYRRRHAIPAARARD